MRKVTKLVIEFVKSFFTAKTKVYASVKEALRNEVVELTFIKANGELSTKYATKKQDAIPQLAMPKGNGKSSESVVTFFSLLDNEWRSMKAEAWHSFRVLGKAEIKKLAIN
jgi:hypothetical protein